MGTYLMGDVAADAHQLCDSWALAHRARFSTPHAEITSPSSPRPDTHILRLTIQVSQWLSSLLAVLIVADLVFYAFALLQLPADSRHVKVLSSGAAAPWFSIPPYLLTWLSVAAVAPSLILSGCRALLDRRERRLADDLERVVGGKSGSFTRLMPPRNWMIFPGDAALLGLGAGLLFALNCMFWLAWLGRSTLIVPLVLPYVALMLGAIAVTAARNWMLRASVKSLDTRLMLRLNRMQLASRISYFFAFPLAFYGLTSLAQAITYALLLKPGFASALPRVHGNSFTIYGMAYLGGGEPQLQDQDKFDRFLATSVLAPSSLDLAAIGVVLAAIVMYLGIFRYWTLLGIYSASGSFPVDRARPPGNSRVPAGRGRATILVQWGFMLTTNLLGTAVILVIILWATHRYMYGPVLEGSIVLPMSALAWYKTVVAMRLGRAVAAGTLALLIIPGALLLVIWAYSLAARIWLAARLLLPARQSARLRGIRSELRGITGRRPPRVRIDKRLALPKMEAFLPFGWACVIRLPQHCLENMNDALLISVIAHEIVHVREHARRLWWLEFLSWLTITGPGLLAMLLDIAAMEFGADEVALQWTGDRRAAVEALEYFQKGAWAGARHGSSRGGGGVAVRVHDAVRSILRPSLTRFRAVFFTFWVSQPGEEAVPMQDRIDRIAGYGA